MPDEPRPEFAAFFETVLRELWEVDVQSIEIYADLGEMIYTNYHNMTQTNMAEAAYHIHKDAIIEGIKASGEEIKAAWEEGEEA